MVVRRTKRERPSENPFSGFQTAFLLFKLCASNPAQRIGKHQQNRHRREEAQGVEPQYNHGLRHAAAFAHMLEHIALLPYPAYKHRHQERADRHNQRSNHVVPQIKQRFAKQLPFGKHAKRERGGNADNKNCRTYQPSGFAAFAFVFADGGGNHGFQHGEGGSERGEHHQQHKHGKQNLPQRQLHKHRGQHHENQPRPLPRLKVEGEHSGENHQTGQQRHQQIHPHNAVAGAEQILFFVQISGISNHGGHAQAQRKKGLPQRGEHGLRREVRPIRLEQERDSRHRAVQRERAHRQQ